ncbi:scopoletin glucosyltransferase-like [Phoenix dactylifera]|uniref:Scopoletin glucosyltransferase-like n=1 Tax=Phoenix dactylifera TaxID=42345 RepID=A0A8B8J591_PHODC|nr:scopoletin glucosyltransferase-like [Phoenix dactylifera]XP_026660650.1 scopoletin glucosyltransferase-like [Phoenix dactylifera]
MGSQTQEQRPLHLVFFPFLARSHMIPMLETAVIAAERGVKATFVTTPANAHLVRPTLDRANSLHQPPMDLRIILFPAADHGLPDGCENLISLPDVSLAGNFFRAVFALRKPLDDLLCDLRPVDALVSDALFPWTTSLAADHSIPRLIFQVTGLFPLCAANDLDIHRPYESVSSRSEPYSIPGFPHPIKFTRAELPEVFDFPYMLGLLREAELTSYGVIVNSFYAFEPDYAEHYYKVGRRKVFLVGPVNLAGARLPSTEKKEDGGRDATLRWLDEKEDDSVVYISFGTLCRFSDEQFRELALGLEASGHPFVWAMRSDGGAGDEWMPEGYEKRVAGRGLVVRGWAPQAEILSHRAVGGFVIHCGWNSVMEGVCSGVALATWPLHSEQFVLEKLLVDVLKIAKPVWDGFKSVVDGEKAVVPANAVARAVALLVGGGEEVAAMRRRVRELAELGRRAVAEGGSSHEDMSRLIEGLMACREEREKSQV